MNAIFAYLMLHWRGEQLLWRSALINGLLAYVTLAVVLVASGPASSRTDGSSMLARLFLLFG